MMYTLGLIFMVTLLFISAFEPWPLSWIIFFAILSGALTVGVSNYWLEKIENWLE